MFRPSESDLRVLTAWMAAGTCARAAEDLGVAEQTVKNRLYLLRLKARVSTNQQLIYEYNDELRAFRRTVSVT